MHNAGGARVSVPDFPSIVRSSLAEPNYGSFGFSMRDPPYECALLTASRRVITAAHTVAPSRLAILVVNPYHVDVLDAVCFAREEGRARSAAMR